MITAGVNGSLFTPDSDRDFIQAAKVLLDDPTQMQGLRQEARREAERWGWEAATQQLEAYYHQVHQNARVAVSQ